MFFSVIMSVLGVSLSNQAFSTCQAPATISWATISGCSVVDTLWIRRNMVLVLFSSHSSIGFISVDAPLLRTSGRFLILLTIVYSFTDLKAHCDALAQVR